MKPTTQFRILYYYGSQQFDTGSPKALASVIDLLDRSTFEPLYLAAADGPLVHVLASRGVAIVKGNVAPVSLRSPIRAVAQDERTSRRWAREHHPCMAQYQQSGVQRLQPFAVSPTFLRTALEECNFAW